MHVPPPTTLPSAPASGPPEADAGEGLTAGEAARRLQTYGPNEIAREEGRPALALLLAQLRSTMVWLLLGASVVSAALGEWVDAAAIGAIVLLNTLIGFLQEFRAERALLALRQMTAPQARVLRDGRPVQLPAAQVVPGDVLLLEEGDVVAADAELLEVHALHTNEAPLTGESLPVEKVLPGQAGEPREGRVFLGTSVTHGTGRAQVTATGMRTELGRIAHLLQTAEVEPTPLQVRLTQVTRTLFYGCLGIVAVIALLGVLRGDVLGEVLLFAVALAVAAVPEGLPTLVTIALALGVQRMARRNVLVRRLQAVETLGSATVVCTDKTGTLTRGVMEVREVWGPDRQAVLFAAAACCDASLGSKGAPDVGDPTELALLRAAAVLGISRDAIERERPRTHVEPFDSERKRMSVLRADGRLYVKGAPEVVVALCVQSAEEPLGQAERMARRGLRVLAVAEGSGPGETALTLRGLVGLADPPRPEATAAVAAARTAGIRPVMITGDHPITALAIAQELGIVAPGETPEGRVHARVSPEDKLRIVREWKARGEVVAMTGDGVNDAPALREAHIGIAMGRTGTEVTREAADLILTDDNFASIVRAVHEGRGIYGNIRKTLVYLLAGNAGELLLMGLASLAGLPLPLLPLHLLWVNLVTDGLPALALVTDPAGEDLLRRPPRPPAEPMLRRHEWRAILLTGMLEAAVVLGAFLWTLQEGGLARARAVAFTTLVFAELLRAFAARHPSRLYWEVGPTTNRALLGVVAASLALQVALVLVPGLGDFLALGAFRPSDLPLALGLGLVPVSVLEVLKLLRRLGGRKGAG